MFKALQLPVHWQKPLLGLLLITLSNVSVFWETWRSMVITWQTSDTFTHGFVVAPISLWLIWARKEQFRYLQAEISMLGLLMMVICGFLWLSADLIHTLVIQQFAVIGMLVCAFWTILGNKVSSKALFPLLFLFLMAPFGDDFVPPLMEYTATFVVTMLRLTGISVYREGLHFTLTSGNWSVIEACSGIRYLIASITLGMVYAYLNYTHFRKRLVLILAAILVPIVANGFRAYMIVMIGHLSDMQLATGIDHIIYGWVFFGLVMLLLFYIGSFWQDPLPEVITIPETTRKISINYPHYWPILSALLLALLIWPPSSAWLSGRQAASLEISEYLLPSEWQPVATAPGWDWTPKFKGVAAEFQHYFRNGDTVVGMTVANFGAETQGELVNSQNVLVNSNNKIWSIMHVASSLVNLSAQQATVEESVLRGAATDILVFRWYKVGSRNTANKYFVKWLQLVKRLSFDTGPELMILLYTPSEPGEYRQARANLQKFAEECCGK